MGKEHTVGSEVNGLRVPEQFASTIGELSTYMNSGASHQEILGKVATILSDIATNEIGDTEIHDGGVLSTDRANFEKRFQPDLHKVSTICSAMRDLGHKIVLTSGSFDLLHLGHAKYLENGSRYGDFLVVGVDSDEKVRRKKGENRPDVTQDERLEMLCYLRSVDIVTLKEHDEPQWQLIKVIRPNTLIASEGTYTSDEIQILENAFVERVVVLPPQATTSTTARLRRLQIGQSNVVKTRIEQILVERLEHLVENEKLAEIRSDLEDAFSSDIS